MYLNIQLKGFQMIHLLVHFTIGGDYSVAFVECKNHDHGFHKIHNVCGDSIRIITSKVVDEFYLFEGETKANLIILEPWKGGDIQ